MAKTIAVTGATGFIGHRVVAKLCSSGFAVRGLTRVQTGVRPEGRMEVRGLDLLDQKSCEAGVAGCDGVVHLAAHIPADMIAPDQAARCMEVNALGTLTLLRAVEKQGVPFFVFMSSGNGYTRRSGLRREDDPILPTGNGSFYLASKLCAEIWVQHFAECRGLAAAVLRPSSIYGPGMRRAGLIPNLVGRLSRKVPATVHDGGRYAADFVYCDDVVAATQVVVKRQMRGVFNVGSGEVTSALAVARLVLGLVGGDESLLGVEPCLPGSAAPGFSGLDTSRMRTLLGIVPTPLKVGLNAYLGWVLSGAGDR
ncbi:MAG: NAD(P)-dependent oxidoreductase [Acidobacteria bacterium]|nr:MAG: NAD(P)-dependent oxidoreductase [Acidobacteriota bacterium]